MQYIYTMIGVSKVVPPKREIIKDISLSLLPRRQDRPARPERLGQVHGAAHHGRRRQGLQRRSAPAAGHQDRLSGRRSRSSIPRRPCAKRSRKASAEILDAQKQLDEVYAAYAEEGADFDKLAAEQQRLEGDPGGQRRPHARAHARSRRRRAAPAAVGREDRPRCPAARSAAWRCAGCCCPSPTCCCSTSRPTISTPNRSNGWSSSCRSFPGTVVAVTHDRYFLDNAAEWILELDRGRGIPWKGNYIDWLEQKDERLQQEEAGEKGAPEGDPARARMGAPGRQGPSVQGQGAPQPLRGTELGRVPEAQRNQRDSTSRRASASAIGDRVQARVEVVRRSPADRRSVDSRFRPARSSASSARTAPASRRCSS